MSKTCAKPSATKREPGRILKTVRANKTYRPGKPTEYVIVPQAKSVSASIDKKTK